MADSKDEIDFQPEEEPAATTMEPEAIPVPPAPTLYDEAVKLAASAPAQLKALLPIEGISDMDGDRFCFVLDAVGAVAMKTLLCEFQLEPWIVYYALLFMAEEFRTMLLRVHAPESMESADAQMKVWEAQVRTWAQTWLANVPANFPKETPVQ